MAIDPRALRSFLAVCREGSISGAARRLHVTQPAVSATINQLEEALGALLFVRARSGITLTAAGVALERRAEALEALLAQAEREIKLSLQNVAGPLIVGGTPGALASLVPGAVARVRQKLPAFELQVLERADSQLTDLLRKGRIEIAIVTTGIVPAGADFREETIMSDPFSLIVGKANAHLPNRLTLSALSGARWVLPDAAGAFRRQLDALFVATEAPTPANVIRCDSLLTTKAIVRETDYVTVLPREVAAAELSIGALREIQIEGAFMRNVGMRYLSGTTPSPAAAAFMEAVRVSGQHPPKSGTAPGKVGSGKKTGVKRSAYRSRKKG